MDKEAFVRHQLAIRGQKYDPDQTRPEVRQDTPKEDMDPQLLSESYYPDVSSFLENQNTAPVAAAKAPGKKGPLRRAREEEFIAKYKEFMCPTETRSKYGEMFLLEDLVVLIDLLCAQWAWAYARNRAGYQYGDENNPKGLACMAVHNALLKHKAEGSYVKYAKNDYQYALATYQCIYHRRAIDGFRGIYGRKLKPEDPEQKENAEKKEKQPTSQEEWERQAISIEAILEDENHVTHMDRYTAFSWNPYESDLPREERDAQNEKLLMLYYRMLMSYNTKPQRALAVMYARVIFQQARARNPKYDVLWEGSWDVQKHPGLIRKAIESSKLSSIPWAKEKMGPQSLGELGTESENIMQTWVDPSLKWGKNFHAQLPLKADYPRVVSKDGVSLREDQTWGELVFTETFLSDSSDHQKAVAHWVTDTHDTILNKVVELLDDFPDLKRFALDELSRKNPINKKLKAKVKEVRR